MLRWRLVWSAVILIPLLLLVAADYRLSGPAPGIWLYPLALLAATAAAAELLDLFREQPAKPSAWSVFGGVWLVGAASGAPLLRGLIAPDSPPQDALALLGWPLLALAAALLWAFVVEMWRYEKPGDSTVQLALAVLIVAYVGIAMSFLMLLRVRGGNEQGMAALLSLLIVVKLSDTGAYATGRLFGRHKLAPQLSPGKTVEGGIGGLVVACLASWAVFRYLVPWLIGGEAADQPTWGWLWFGLLVTVCGVVGDLAMSLLKRDAQRKDSSSWLPGLGGVLDVLDSLLLAAPAAYFCWATGLVGPVGG